MVHTAGDLCTARMPTDKVCRTGDLKAAHIMAFHVQGTGQFKAFKPARITADHVEGGTVHDRATDKAVGADRRDQGDLPVPLFTVLQVRRSLHLA